MCECESAVIRVGLLIPIVHSGVNHESTDLYILKRLNPRNFYIVKIIYSKILCEIL